MQFPTIRRANRLFLLTIVLILTLGAAIQFWNLPLGVIGTEVLLLFLPTWWFLRRDRLNLVSVLRLKRPHPAAFALSPLIGAGAWVVGTALNSLLEYLMGYASPGVPLHGSASSVLLMILAIVAFAPLCEEALFRGYLFRAYETRGPRAAVLVTSLLFAFYHMRFQGLVPLLPVAFALGYVRLRSDSLWPAVAVHLFNNGTAVVGGVVWAALHPGQTLALPAALVAAGVLVLAAALFAFERLVRPLPDAGDPEGTDVQAPEDPPAAPEDRPTAPEHPAEPDPQPSLAEACEGADSAAAAKPADGRWTLAWPLVVFGIIWLVFAAAEFVISRNPALLHR